MSTIFLQDLWDEAEAEVVAPLNATIATQGATIAANATVVAVKDAQIASQAAQIASLQSQLAGSHPVPTSNNTGFRGGLASAAASVLTGASNTVIENKQISYPTSFSGAGVTLKNDRVYSLSAGVLDGSAAAGFVMIDTVIVGSYKGAGTFIRCNIAALELTAASIVTDCYIPGGITGAGKAASTITNTTVVP